MAIVTPLRYLADIAARCSTPEERAHIALMDETVEMEARRLASLCNGLGCLIAEDGSTKRKTGSFQQPEDLSGLLFLLANHAESLADLIDVAREARDYGHNVPHGRA